MEWIRFEKVRQGKYLRNYEITYLNKAGKEKTYEMVSFNEMTDVSQLGNKTNGISIAATVEGKLLLLKEFRMAVGRTVYNLCAGMIEPDETVEDCISRELYEEVGLKVKRIKKILPPSFAAVGISDTCTRLCFIEAEGSLAFHGSDNEQIQAGLYSKEEVEKLLETESFSSRSQLVAYAFLQGMFDQGETES
ncbi:MAG: NUDIX hydrolase [Lachnospiraceae bacterium]|jgi:ADP-ribose pyrophosphatase|nr:NUDIX hydrolase [Lachnospiraceae bacterium]